MNGETVDVRTVQWVDPVMWPAPEFAQVGERQCPVWGLGEQCQRPRDHDGMHAHQGRLPNGEYLTAAWGAVGL